MPKLYTTEKIPNDEKIVQVKFFSPYNGWTWYAVEYDPQEKIFYGLVKGFEMEWGYFALEELESLTAMNGKLPLVERDMYFDPISIGELRKKGVL